MERPPDYMGLNKIVNLDIFNDLSNHSSKNNQD
jgi:hypothetical protein